MKRIIILVFLLLQICIGFSQSVEQTYPKIVSYASVIHPIATFDNKGGVFNFTTAYNVGFPIGISIFKNSKIAFSFEIAPFMKFREDTSKVNFILFHPGVVYKFHKNISFINRLAFETNGKFGYTPILNFTVLKLKNANGFLAFSTPFRMGNGKSPNVAAALQIGFTF